MSTHWSRQLPLAAAAVVGIGAFAYWRLWGAEELSDAKDEHHDGGKIPTDEKRPSEGASAGDASDSKVHVYFGSQTGTARDFSAKVAAFIASIGPYEVEVIDLANFDEADFVEQRRVVFVVATYMEGSPTDNAKRFAQWLGSEERAANCLDGQLFAVCGLGDRQYSTFCAVAHYVDRHMRRLGASSFCPIGEADDDRDIEQDFEDWMETSLKIALSKTADGKSETSRLPAVSELWKTHKRGNFDVESAATLAGLSHGSVEGGGEPSVPTAHTNANFYDRSQWVPLKAAYDVKTSKTGRWTKHLEFDLSHTAPRITYTAGNVVEILPPNPPEIVDWFAHRIGLSLGSSSGVSTPSVDDFVNLIPRTQVLNSGDQRDIKAPFPTPCRIREVLSCYCSLWKVPSKRVLQDLIIFCDDPEERANMEKLLSEENKSIFQKCVVDSHMTLKDFLEAFMPLAKIEWGGFLQLVGRQRRRLYTIRSPRVLDDSSVAVIVSQLAYDLPALKYSLQRLKEAGLLSPNAPAPTKSNDYKIAKPRRRRRFDGLCSAFLTTRQMPNSLHNDFSQIPHTERYKSCVRLAIREYSTFELESFTGLKATSALIPEDRRSLLPWAALDLDKDFRTPASKHRRDTMRVRSNFQKLKIRRSFSEGHVLALQDLAKIVYVDDAEFEESPRAPPQAPSKFSM